ncbi:MAG: hypothetical protein ACI837_000471 [Crocinitomicaceae bacterium]|jgi:hypothetical protein
MRPITFLLFILTFAGNAISQSHHLTQAEKFIDDYVQKLDGSLSFQNGINTYIEKPANDTDALHQGFKTSQCDLESNGEWELLFAKDVDIDNQTYRAICYEHFGKMHMAIYRQEKSGKYYFRIWC